jgi:hypothetical protein
VSYPNSKQRTVEHFACVFCYHVLLKNAKKEY